MGTAHLLLPGRGSASSLAIAVAVLAIGLAACSGPPVASPRASASPGVGPGATELPRESPDVAVRWEPAGTSAFEMNDYFHAVALQDGRVLVVGSRRADPRAELWDPSTNAWARTQPLNKPRYAFAAVGLRDGRVLVAGGLNEGTGWGDGNNESFSSAYLFDPSRAGETWSKVDLMGVARTAPAAALLPDGRVLVAGGYFYQGAKASPSPPPGTSGRREFGFAWDTAELFDPGAGTWTTTGSMHQARAGAGAVTLTDGRVLVVGSGAFAVARLEDGAFVSAEIYDPRTGRFSRTGGLPPVDREALAGRGIQLPDGDGRPWALGTLVALPDGGALLVGNTRVWDGRAEVTRTLRFDAWAGAWTEAQAPWASYLDGASGQWLATPGIRRHAALASRLADGRVLVAGGESAGIVAATAELFDPATGDWLTLPEMPFGRADGDAVRLTDGSVMLVGGYGSDGFARTALRMVP
jgi:hypothetical protein